MTRSFLPAVAAVLLFAACSSAPAPSAPGPSETQGAAANDAGTIGPVGTSPGASPATEDAGVAAAADSGSPSDPSPQTDAGPDASPHSDAGGPAAPAIDYAPYFPTWVWGGSGYAFTGLADLQKKSGLNEVTIAFVLSNGGCDTTQDIEDNAADVKAFRSAGGHVKASFGGADGAYVESKCSDAASFAAAIEAFVDATGITDLDFDIEQDPVLTDSVNAMRGSALKLAQDARGIQVAFTLAANPHTSGSPGGLTSQGLSVVTHAVAAGVVIRHVNLMTMDYGDSYAGQPLAPVAIGSLTDANAQLVANVPGLTAAKAWAMLGVIPMIGKNDDSEVFSLADATTLEGFATSHGLGLVSFWSIDRDQPCPSGADYNSCSTVDATSFAFNGIFKAVTE
jgi:chitinase